ncbi:sensor histidine kinase [Paracoccaceae bacterium GXU_MW_L88]
MAQQAAHTTPSRRRPYLWLVAGLVLIATLALIVMASSFLGKRYTAGLRDQAGIRANLYTGAITSLLQRSSVVPLLLSRDSELIQALRADQYPLTSQRLIEFRDELGASSIVLLDDTGRTVASSDRALIGTNMGTSAFYTAALRDLDTIFTSERMDNNVTSFYFARRIMDGNQLLGVVGVAAELSRLEESWQRSSAIITVTDSEGNVILSSRPAWRGQNYPELMNRLRARGQFKSVTNFFSRLSGSNDLVEVGNTNFLEIETPVRFRGWQLHYLASIEDVRARVSAAIATAIMALSLIATGIFFLLVRIAQRSNVRLTRESAELRALNQRLTEEIGAREEAEQSLRVAEQSLVQASKLASLGEMSAAVSHELNQPLAAMRTYLASARLLLQRQRHNEALSSFQRIDDLLTRMGAITRQLKSFARKGSDDVQRVDLRNVVDAALSMMTPQFSRGDIEVTRMMPPHPLMVMGDPLRLEQIIVNLLRNAVDATAGQEERKIDIFAMAGRRVHIRVRDNGHGIDDPEALFEPFYTTKPAGEGTGLGLALSAGFANDMGGRLTARNIAPRGALFELELPALEEG